MNSVQEALVLVQVVHGSSEICLYNQYSSIKGFVNYHVYFVSIIHLERIYPGHLVCRVCNSDSDMFLL